MNCKSLQQRVKNIAWNIKTLKQKIEINDTMGKKVSLKRRVSRQDLTTDKIIWISILFLSSAENVNNYIKDYLKFKIM